MKTKIFDFNIPEYLIAQYPSKKRSDSRLLIYDRKKDLLTDSFTKNISTFLDSRHFLAFNNTRVIPARFFIKKKDKDNDKVIEVIILKIIDEERVEVLMKNAKKCSAGTELEFPGNKKVIIEKSFDNGIKLIKSNEAFFKIDYLEKFGRIPLPPYIKKNPDKTDKKRYQTTFSIHHGSSAAPTAGLHFDKKIFKSLDKKNIQYSYVTLHVGLGTFQPIYTENIEDHKIHTEEYYIDENEAREINQAINDDKKIIPVGTTSLRTLETAFKNNEIKSGKGESGLYIYPPYKFKVACGLITNFHTPRSSLAVLVSAMIGVERLLEIYKYAVEKEYRFFSYGDAMLIL